MADSKGNGTTMDFEHVAALRSGIGPLYHSFGHVIRTRVESGDWPPDTQIPSERALMEMLGISRATVRHGIELMVREGILYRMHGKGTFVAQPKINQGVRSILNFTETMRRNGLNPQALLLAKAQVEPPPNVRQTLGLGGGDQAIWFQRLLSIGSTPISIETAYFSANRFPGLLDLYNGSDDPHRFVYSHYNVYVTREREIFEPVILESREAAQLGVKGGFPALWVEHVAFDVAETPTAFLTSLLRGDRCRFVTDLSNG